MDDTTNKQVQNSQQVNPVGQPVQQPPTAPVQPVGGKKEAPVGMPASGEWVSPSTPEIILPQEVKAAGVEAHPVVPQVSQAAAQSGVRMANEAMTVAPVGVETINIQTPRNILNQLKSVHKSVKDSFSWLIRLIIKEQDKREKGEKLV